MDPVTSLAAAPSAAPAATSNSFAELGSQDFFRLMLTQLTNQDPLEPTGNKELLEQISSIRDIELSTTLSESLRILTGQQRFTSASSLIGQHVTGTPAEDGTTPGGVVVAVRFEPDGTPVLQLANGETLPLDRVSAIMPLRRAAEAIIGQAVVGADRRPGANGAAVEGVVTAVKEDTNGDVLLELDNGGDLRFIDVVSIASLQS